MYNALIEYNVIVSWLNNRFMVAELRLFASYNAKSHFKYQNEM